ncbi:uroporphyrinogen decarboxylase [Thalassotalea ponticola]|uniref:uroporphyrinogen decarboxylase n=1 Tax=Thalassotalea ponticola TaxID=1523392 RepID=UPI0025B45DD3|nr:uroporphyrinogen decarboxylase [Thalassotalea ponticola]MDN3653144.1 uroporphyrinogen decarboxylase [Thalassotalea ponticola]
MEFIELFGFVASVVVAVSLMMKNIVHLRIANMIGCAMFSAYGFIIGSLPVGCMNAFIMFVNIYYLTKMYINYTHSKATPEGSLA